MTFLATNSILSSSQIANIRDILGGGGIYGSGDDDEVDPLEGTVLQSLLSELAESQAAAAESGETTGTGTFRTREGSTPSLDVSEQIAVQSVLPSPEEAAAFDEIVDLTQLQAGIFVEFRAGSDLSSQNIDDATRLDQAVVDLQARNGSNLGLLGYDVNGNGVIDNEGELFGFDDDDQPG